MICRPRLGVGRAGEDNTCILDKLHLSEQVHRLRQCVMSALVLLQKSEKACLSPNC